MRIKNNLRKESPILVFDLNLKKEDIVRLLNIRRKETLNVLTGATIADVTAGRILDELIKS